MILWGGSGDAAISVNDVARLAQTISYEMLCTVGGACREFIELAESGADMTIKSRFGARCSACRTKAA